MKAQLLCSVFAFGCATAAVPAFAQGQPESGAAASSDATIREIIVTAERRTSTAQKTAAAISVRSGEEMLTKGRYSLTDILEDVPGVDGGAATSSGTSGGSGSDSPARGLIIRGIQSNNGVGGSTVSTSAAAALYVDDVYNGLGSTYDLDRVEVLRGPQGTLYGRSATSGVVAIHARAPDLRDLGGDISFEAGTANLLHASGALNVPLIDDKLAIRASGNYYARDDYYAPNGGNYNENRDGRVKLLAKPTDNLSIMLGFAFEDNKTRSQGYTINQTAPNVFAPIQENPWSPGTNKSRQYWAVVDLDLGGAVLTYVPAYRTYEQHAILQQFGALTLYQTVDTPKDHFLTQELRLRSDMDSPLQWQTGVMYYHNSLRDFNHVKNGSSTGPTAFRSATDKTTEQIGGFAEGTYSFTESTRLTAGIRYDHTKVEVDQAYLNLAGFGLTVGNPGDDLTSIFPAGTIVTPGGSGTRTYNNVTWKVRLEQDITPANMVYASVSTAFSPGDVVAGTAPFTMVPSVFNLKAETLTSYELGSKNRFAGGRLQLNGAVFYYDYAGFQVANINVNPTGAPQFVPLSIPVRSYGAEAEMLARPWKNGQISANLAYTNAEYKSLPVLYADLFSTKKIPGVAPWQASASYRHTVDIDDASKLFLTSSLRYNSSYLSTRVTQLAKDLLAPRNINADDFVRIPDRATLDLNAMLSLEDGKFTLTAYVRNVTNNNGKLMADSQLQGGGHSSTATLVDPRTFGVVATAHF